MKQDFDVSPDELATEEWLYASRFTRAAQDSEHADWQVLNLTEPAKLFGFTGPVLVTHAVWVELVAEYCRGTATLETARFNAVLLAFRDAIAKRHKHPSGRVYFSLTTCDGEGTYYDLALMAQEAPAEDGSLAWIVSKPGQR